MVDGPYVDDLKVSQIGAFLEKQLAAGTPA